MGKTTPEEIKEKLKEIHSDTLTLDENTYINTKIKCRFIDKDYGEWWAIPDNVINKKQSHPKRRTQKTKQTCLERYGIYNPEKSFNKPLKTIQDCHNLASLKNGKFLSTEYKGSLNKYLWECEKGHQWKSKYNSVQQGCWCPVCSGKTKHNIQDCHNLASLKNGKCLSTEYKGSFDYHLWECSHGHQWKAKFNKIQQGRWCPECYKQDKKITIEKCNLVAQKNNGIYLSQKDPLGCHEKLLWKCKLHGNFYARYTNIKYGQWCPTCAEDKRIQTRIKKYGYPYLMQNKELALKSSKTKNEITILHNWKDNSEIACRGSYEVAVVNYLNNYRINFLWQPQTFILPDNKTYTPDLYLPDQNLWIEIKGYFYDDALEKWDWFHKEHTNSELWDKEKLKEMIVL